MHDRYAGALESSAVEPRLRVLGKGAFLVRDSTTRPGSFTLSVLEDACQHIVIHRGDVGFVVKMIMVVVMMVVVLVIVVVIVEAASWMIY